MTDTDTTPEITTGLARATELMIEHRKRLRTHTSPEEFRDDLLATEEEILFTLLSSMWNRGQVEAMVVTPATLDRELEYEDCDLTDAERDTVVEGVMNDPLLDDVFEPARKLLSEIIRDHVARAVFDR